MLKSMEIGLVFRAIAKYKLTLTRTGLCDFSDSKSGDVVKWDSNGQRSDEPKAPLAELEDLTIKDSTRDKKKSVVGLYFILRYPGLICPGLNTKRFAVCRCITGSILLPAFSQVYYWPCI